MLRLPMERDIPVGVIRDNPQWPFDPVDCIAEAEEVEPCNPVRDETLGLTESIRTEEDAVLAEHPIAIVGDSLFAGSMGGGQISFQDALKNNREKILTLPEDTIICPGHGPLTSVAEEMTYNPFFPELK